MFSFPFFSICMAKPAAGQYILLSLMCSTVRFISIFWAAALEVWQDRQQAYSFLFLFLWSPIKANCHIFWHNPVDSTNMRNFVKSVSDLQCALMVVLLIHVNGEAYLHAWLVGCMASLKHLMLSMGCQDFACVPPCESRQRWTTVLLFCVCPSLTLWCMTMVGPDLACKACQNLYPPVNITFCDMISIVVHGTVLM